MKKRFIVRLTAPERVDLEERVTKGEIQADRIKPADLLLKIGANEPNGSDKQTAETFSCRSHTVGNVRQRFVEEGFSPSAWLFVAGTSGCSKKTDTMPDGVNRHSFNSVATRIWENAVEVHKMVSNFIKIFVSIIVFDVV